MWLIGNGALNVAAHFLIVLALGQAQASVVTPFKYAGLLWSLLLGFVLFDDLPDRPTLAGAGVVVLAGLYLLSRSASGTSPPAGANRRVRS